MANADLSTRYQRFFQYFWDPEPRNDDTTGKPMWCLGRNYPGAIEQGVPKSTDQIEPETQDLSTATSPQRNKTDAASDAPWPPAFLDDFEAKFWFTYRNEFPAIPRSTDAALTLAVRLRNIGDTAGFSSDTGWGCMIRSGQCLLSNALSVIRLGRDWRRGESATEEKRLLSLFSDDPRAPFSIHKFVEHGATACGKHPGEWFGPSATAQCIQALAQSFPESGLDVYIAAEGAQVYEGSLLKAVGSGDDFKPVLILAGLRLGIDRVTPTYRRALEGMLAMKQSVGIAGGRPSASHYFVAVQGENFFYLDPHHPRPALPWHDDPLQYTDEEVDSCHTRRLRRLNVDKMDPSMLVAFLIQSADDWSEWKQAIQTIPGTAILHITSGEPPGNTVTEREDALNEVEAFDDEDSDGEAEFIGQSDIQQT